MFLLYNTSRQKLFWCNHCCRIILQAEYYNTEEGSDIMPLEIELLETENLGNILTIAAYIVFFISATMSIKMEQSGKGGTDSNIDPTPSETMVGGSWIYVLGSYILFDVSFERIKQRREQLQSGTASGTLLPNIWIGISTLLTLFASLALLKGTQQRVLEEGQVTII